MKVQAYKTKLIEAGDDLVEVISEAIEVIPENSFLCVASKAFSYAENAFVAYDVHDPESRFRVIKQEAEQYTQEHSPVYKMILAIKEGGIYVNAGVDESNADGQLVLWPENPRQSVNTLWKKLRQVYNIKNLGIIMTDSIGRPLQWGITGYGIAYCGFEPLYIYVGKKDLYGRTMRMEKLSILQSVAAAACLCMGEGDEQQPLAIATDVPNAVFMNRPPTDDEIKALYINPADDIYAPILTSVDWKLGGKG